MSKPRTTRLFPVSRRLLTQARDFLKEDTDALIESHSILDPDTGKPKEGTLDSEVVVEVTERLALIGKLNEILRS